MNSYFDYLKENKEDVLNFLNFQIGVLDLTSKEDLYNLCILEVMKDFLKN